MGRRPRRPRATARAEMGRQKIRRHAMDGDRGACAPRAAPTLTALYARTMELGLGSGSGRIWVLSCWVGPGYWLMGWVTWPKGLGGVIRLGPATGLARLWIVVLVDPVPVAGPVVGFWAGLAEISSRAPMKLDLQPFHSKIKPK